MEYLWPFGYYWTPVPSSMASSSESWEWYSIIFEESQVYPPPIGKWKDIYVKYISHCHFNSAVGCQLKKSVDIFPSISLKYRMIFFWEFVISPLFMGGAWLIMTILLSPWPIFSWTVTYTSSGCMNSHP